MNRSCENSGYSDMQRNPDNEAVPDVLIFRVEASLLYFNVEHVRDAVRERMRSSATPPKLMVCDLSTSPMVDLAGVRMLANLHSELEAAGVRLRLVSAHAAVRDILRADGMEPKVGDCGRRILVSDVIESFQAENRSARLHGRHRPRTHVQAFETDRPLSAFAQLRFSCDEFKPVMAGEPSGLRHRSGDRAITEFASR